MRVFYKRGLSNRKNVNKEAFVIQTFGSRSSFIGDDAAVIDRLLYSQDAFFENVHYKKSWMTPYQIGYKAMMVNISDAIAMNAQPKYALLTLAFPKNEPKQHIEDLMRGLSDAASLYNCEIIGGDTIANIKLDLSITIVSESKNALRRHTVKEGDFLAYTGQLGSVKKDLSRLFRSHKCSSNSRFIRPVLRQEFVSKAFRYINSGLDISDGLYEDSTKLTATIKRRFKPHKKLPKSVACSGEEYEMLVSVAPRKVKALKRVAKRTRTPLTVFAKVVRGKQRSYCKANHF